MGSNGITQIGSFTVYSVDENGNTELNSTEIGGIIKITRDSDDKLHVWELDEALALLDY